MAITYKWTIKELIIKKQKESLQNIVELVRWQLEAIDEEGCSAIIKGTETLEAPKLSDFVDFQNLTEQMVIQWLESSMKKDVRTIEKIVEMTENPQVIMETKNKLEMHKDVLMEIILDKKIPSVENKSPPWIISGSENI